MESCVLSPRAALMLSSTGFGILARGAPPGVAQGQPGGEPVPASMIPGPHHLSRNLCLSRHLGFETREDAWLGASTGQGPCFWRFPSVTSVHG